MKIGCVWHFRRALHCILYCSSLVIYLSVALVLHALSYTNSMRATLHSHTPTQKQLRRNIIIIQRHPKNAIMENFRSQWHQFKRNDMANVRATSKYIHRLCVCRMPARLLICLCNCFICWADKFYLFALRWIENRDNESADDNLMGSNVFGCAARHDNCVCAHFSGHNS